MKKVLNSLLILTLLISCMSIQPRSAEAAGEKPFNYSYVGWNYDKEGRHFRGIIPALNNTLATRPWKLLQWPAEYKFPDAVVRQTNYDAFSIQKQYDSDNFMDENGFGLIYKNDASVTAFFDMVMKNEIQKVTPAQINYFRDRVLERSHSANLKEGHPTFFTVENKKFLYIPGVIPWMGGRFEGLVKEGKDVKVPTYLMSAWPKLWVDSATAKITFLASGYSDRTLKIMATKKGAFPDLSGAVSISNKSVSKDNTSYQDSVTADADKLIKQLGKEVDIIIDDGYGRLTIESATLTGKTTTPDGNVDFVPTKLNLTNSGQLWMTFRYDGKETIKTADIVDKDGMPMLAKVKIGGAVTGDFDLSMLYKQLPANLVPKETYNALLGKINLGEKPGKYYIKVTGIVNNPNHPKHAIESPADAYKNNEISAQWVREVTAGDHDLIAISITSSPSKMTDKQTSTVKASVKNLGPSAQNDVRIRFFSNGQQIYETKKDLPANKTVQVGGFTYKPNAEGAYSLSVHVDPLAEKKDKNRTNNVASTGCIVTSGDPYGACTKNDTVSGNWDVSYSVITSYRVKTGHYSWTDSEGKARWESYTYTDYNDPVWSTRNVNYKETLKVSGSVNTKQGIETDPDRPKESDRESRGSWEIIPYAKDKGLNANEVTRAGYGFELKVTTEYSTDWETKVPKGLGNTAQPIGGAKLTGSKEAKATIYDSAGKFVTTVNLDKTSDDGNTATFEFPIKSYTDDVTNKTYKERKFMTDHKAPDGKYRIEVMTGAAGMTGISACKTFYVTIYGSMYDDVQNLKVTD